MASVYRLGKQIEEVIATLDAMHAPFALIGGLALASHKVIRATQDIDNVEFVGLGYKCAHRNADAANYLRGDERVDFLFASRPIARRLLANAGQYTTSFGVLRVISSEGLIAFKLQGLVNDPRRTQDLEDIRSLLRANRETLDMQEVREYFRLFGREPMLDELLNAG